ncbi:MAG: DUF962 domain-containing protein [Candidatus Sericytochromatia bacterium]|nr:DUF962 domain-containing protein [Candidatus Sericytochromatia bacterium]
MNTKQIASAELVGGMALLLLGHKRKGLGLFGHGMYALEQEYRAARPDLEPGFEARWREAVTFYDATHQNETNRQLHRWGIPVIVAGALGLLLAKPRSTPWKLSALAFGGGWALNILGHSQYEKNAPAFTEDPLSFVAGPAWDLKQLLGKRQNSHNA